MSVKVLGTVFNFHVDKAHQQASVSLLEGKVRVEGNHDEGMIVLKPGQKACVDARLGSMTVSEPMSIRMQCGMSTRLSSIMQA